MNNIVVKDTVSDKTFDSVSGKVFGASGKVISDTVAKRKELVEELYNKLQNSISQVSGTSFLSRIDNIENYLYELETYVNSLKEAATSIVQNYPNDDKDAPLTEISDLCSVMQEGIGNVKQYLSVTKNFSNDLDNIKNEFFTQIQHLFLEI